MGWTWGGLVIGLAMQLVYTAVMSRTVDPRAFGLVAAALVGLRFVTYLGNFGIGSAVVQRPELDDDDVSTALALSVAIGIVVAITAFVASPVLAAVVREPEAAAVMRWLALGLFLSAITTVPEALLRRTLRFKAMTMVQLIGFAIGYLMVGIPLAVRGWGVWSLVSANIVQSAVLLTGYAATARLPHRFAVSRPAARALLGFGGTVTATGFLEFLTSSLDTLAVGRWIGSAGLGQYSRGTSLVSLPVERATTATTRVLLPALRADQRQRERFAAAFLHGAALNAIVIVVPVALAASAAPALVPILLGPGWRPAALVLPIVGIAYGIGLLTHLAAIAAEAQGTVRLKLGIQVTTLAALVAAIGITVGTGPSLTRFALCWLGAEMVRFLLYWVLVVPRLGVHRIDLARRYASAILLALGAAAPVIATVRLGGAEGIIALGLSSLGGLALAAAVGASPAARVLRQDLAAVRSRLRSA
ncbi:MAG: oligosaccharide flippase family protein [Actinomycetota bacterium]